nr:ATP-binding cassette domain-containing protein [uncultured Mediterraneibacter sp.]
MAVTVKIRRKLDSFPLDIEFHSESKRIGILGASGCGKSMTLKSIAGIELPDEGYIEAEGRTLFDSEGKINLKPQMRNVGYLFQNYALFPAMTVEKNIAAGLKGSRQEKETRVREMVEKFCLQGLEKRLPAQLSGGQQQRVALARIMAYEPDVILLDEPFSALDMYLKDQLQRELSEMLSDYKGTVIMVSHNRDEVYRFSEELLVIDQGKVAVSGETKEIFRDPVSREAARLTGCKNFSEARRIDTHTIEAKDWGVTLTTKREIPEYTRWIGYRAHDFIPVWSEAEEWKGNESAKEIKSLREDMLRFDMESSAELPFEKNYYIKAETTVCWFVQREQARELEEKGMPDYLAFNEEKLLFLR